MNQNHFTGVHHVAIICSDYGASKRFYTDVLQAEIVSEVFREDRKSYKLNVRLTDGVEIELFSFETPPQRPSYPEARGLRHLALSVSDIDAAADWIKAHGISVEDIRVDELTGARFTFFHDPDRLPIEIYEVDD